MTGFVMHKRKIINILNNLNAVIEDEGDTAELRFKKYKTILHARHDLLHLLVCELYQTQAYLGTEKRLGDYFDQDTSPGTPFYLTPDIVVIRSGKVYIVDVTIAYNYTHEANTKLIKYSKCVDAVSSLGFSVEYYTCGVSPGLENLNSAIDGLPGIRSSVRDFDFFFHPYNQVQRMVEEARSLVPDEMMARAEMTGKPFRSEMLPIGDYEQIYKDCYLNDIKYEHSQESAEEMLKQLFDDPDVREKLRDKPHYVGKYHQGFNKLDELEPDSYADPRPTLHFAMASPITISETMMKIEGLRVDQQNSIRIISEISQHPSSAPQIEMVRYLKESLSVILDNPDERMLFNTGYYTGTKEGDMRLREEHSATSIRKEVWGPEGRLRTERPYAERSHQIAIKPLKGKAKDFEKKSGTQFQRNNPAGREYGRPMSCRPECGESIETFLELMCTNISAGTQFSTLLNTPVGLDAASTMGMKKEFRENFKHFLNRIGKTLGYYIAYHTMLAADQMIHHTSLNTKDTSYSLINTGQPNVLHIIRGGALNRGSDVGLPFFTAIITDNRAELSNVYGKISIYPHGERYIGITGWRRLSLTKLSFIRDSYYSTLSTGFDTFTRCTFEEGSEYMKFVYTFRVLVSLCTSQRVAELLLDVRYLVMSCYSDYTNVPELIVDKFGPHYPNCFSRWIISQLKKKVLVMSEAYKSGDGFASKTPIFHNQERIRHSLGGSIRFPSLWTDHCVEDLQGFFDELFVYVHTMKEPSSQFYESVKAIDTILKFEGIFEHQSVEERSGIHTVESFKHFLMSGCQVGCWSEMIFHNAKHEAREMNCPQLRDGIDKETCQEVLSDIESTKACVPEYNLTKDTGNMTKAERSKRDKIRMLQNYANADEHMWFEKEYESVHTDSTVLHGMHGRSKVHDVQLDYLLRHDDGQTVLGLAHWNIFQNSSRVTAHICIKAQYGAKREFYVLNHGAKAAVRIYENIYKRIAKHMPEEMISVPGDRKMFQMSQNLKETVLASEKAGDITYFVNGDCTKWSASETMASFWAMADGMLECVGEQATGYSKCLLASWCKKEIAIPEVLLRGVRYIGPKTEYMRNSDSIMSTQNFLQGMFNYSSSVKAVLAARMSVRLWNKWYPSRKIIVRHLEHSDDYNVIVRVKRKEDFEDFRILHRLCQRVHGIKDSDKKTNCQRFIMEFISLMSFNGEMAYPSIKKTKEVGLNISGEGYQRDIMNVHSRSGEAVRLGVKQESAYVVQLLQGINIYNRYSISKQFEKVFGAKDTDPYNRPIELFGLPDCLPLFYSGTVGDPNNYRLFSYGNKREIIGLYNKTMEEMFVDYPDGALPCPTFYTPVYTYKMSGRRVKKIQQLIGKDVEKVREYWDSHPHYLICKPRETGRYKEWLQYMYYNKSFMKAYSQASRQSIMLRMSFFVSGHCIATHGEPITISEYWKGIDESVRRLGGMPCNTNDIQRLLSCTDPTIPAFFKTMESASIHKLPGRKPAPPVVEYLPNCYDFMKLENNFSTVIEYMLSEEDFYADRRRCRGVDSLIRDKKSVLKLTGKATLTAPEVLICSKLMKSQHKKRTVGLTYGRGSDRSPIAHMVATLQEGVSSKAQYRVIMQQEVSISDPITGEFIYERDYQFTTNRTMILLENMSQVYYLLAGKYQMSPEDVSEIMSGLHDPQTGRGMSEILSDVQLDFSGNADIFHKRMYTYLSAALLLKTEPLIKFVNNEHTIKHSYYNESDLSSLKKSGVLCDDACAFLFGGGYYTIIKNGERRILFSEAASVSKCYHAYTVGLLLFKDITQRAFEKSMLSGGYHHVPPPENNCLEDSLSIVSREWHFLTEYQKMFNVTKNKDLANLPFVMKSFLPHRKLDQETKIKLNPVIDLDRLCVRSGDMRLFNLPLWPCGSNIIIRHTGFTLEDGVSLNYILEGGKLYFYLRQKMISVDCDEQMPIEWQLPESSPIDHIIGDKARNAKPDPESYVGSLGELIDDTPLRLMKVTMDIKLDYGDDDEVIETPCAQPIESALDEEEIRNIEESLNTLMTRSALEEKLGFKKLHVASGPLIPLITVSKDSDLSLEHASVEEMRSEVEAPHVPELFDLGSDISSLSSDTDEDFLVVNKAYIELSVPKEIERDLGYTLGSVRALPKLSTYLRRCWAGEDFLGWISDLKNCIQCLKLLKRVKGMSKLTPTEIMLCDFLSSEISARVENNNVLGECDDEGYTCKIEYGEIKIMKTKSFYKLDAALRYRDRCARGASDVVEETGNFIVHTPVSDRESEDFWMVSPVRLPKANNDFWKGVHDLLSSV